MPDPGEPHRPEREDYPTDETYLDALEGWADMTYPPSEIRTFHEARTGMHDIEKYLEENSER
jgi:hypothetical protein